MNWASRMALLALQIVLLLPGMALRAEASGALDVNTIVSDPIGSFGGIAYVRHEAMFAGMTSTGHPYRVPCRMIAPAVPANGSGLLLVDWPNVTAAATAIGHDVPLGRYILTDSFLFGQRALYATVRADKSAIGTPWSEGTLTTSSESIPFSADEFEIFADFARAMQTDPKAINLIGPVNRKGAFAYSHEGTCLRGLVRSGLGRGLFDFSLLGGAGGAISFPRGTAVDSQLSSVPPLNGTGLTMEFNTQTDVEVLDAALARLNAPNLRVYEFAGASHIRQTEAALFGLPSSETANPADWLPFVRALFVAANAWCDGVAPPASLWLGAPGDPALQLDAKGNARVQFLGGNFIQTDFFRLPEVAVGVNRYSGFDEAFNNGTFRGLLRSLAGSFVDLTGTFSNHANYVEQIKLHARTLEGRRYLLTADADAIINAAIASPIGL